MQQDGSCQRAVGVGGGKEEKGQVGADRRDLTLGGEHTVRYTDDISQNFTPETRIILLTDLTFINLIKRDVCLYSESSFYHFFPMENFTIYFYSLF